MLEVLLDVNMNSYMSPILLLWTMIITTIMYFYSKSHKILLRRWGCREHFVSECWHSSGRDRGRYPRECWSSTFLGVLHPGVPVMWYGHIRDLFPTAWDVRRALYPMWKATLVDLLRQRMFSYRYALVSVSECGCVCGCVCGVVVCVWGCCVCVGLLCVCWDWCVCVCGVVLLCVCVVVVCCCMCVVVYCCMCVVVCC